jgi:hypothetical protein
MKIEQVTKGQCAFCKNPASKKIEGELFCSQCADNEILKHIKKCMAEITHAIVTIKVLPKKAVLKEAKRGKKSI